MTASVKPTGTPTREEFAERLLRGSVKKSYEPVVDIDWDAPLDPDKYFLPPRSVSLYGTPLWDAMSRAQQIELSRQEFINTLSAGIWFENILNQALLRDLMHQDPTAKATHYALTEMGDETRHMVMFGRAIEKVGGKPMRPRRWQRMLINGLPLTFRGSLLWVAALVGEEIFDSLQRTMMDDPDLQPVVQRIMRIHVTEEARHIQFARDGARKRVAEMPWLSRVWVANLNGVGGLFFRHLFTNGAMYRRVGLDPREARDVARASAHHHGMKVLGFASLAAFLDDVGLLGPIARRLWTRTDFLPRTGVTAADARSGTGRTDEVYDGPAVLTAGGTDHATRVRLTGRLESIDGRYHWQGTIFGELPDDVLKQPRVSVTVGDRTVHARLTERTSQGTHAVVGEGAPPFG